jgi:hypothetical protein
MSHMHTHGQATNGARRIHGLVSRHGSLDVTSKAEIGNLAAMAGIEEDIPSGKILE